jgi:adenosylcobinamide amidohydrolase
MTRVAPVEESLGLGQPAFHDRARQLLIVRFSRPHATLSWAVVNGGRSRASAVVWRYVCNAELTPEVDPEALLRGSLTGVELPDAVGLLTSCDLSRFEDVQRSDGELGARCVVTIGLSNALAAGDPPGPLLHRVGTINLLCQLSQPLGEGALVEACALAAEARTAALLEASVPSRRTGRPATGTGTDCIVIAAPDVDDDDNIGNATPLRYVGKHTAAGALIGAVVREACTRGIARWLEATR